MRQKKTHMFAFCFAVRVFADIPLTDDFSKASEIAQAYNRPMILLFTGSDWCKWSEKILEETLPLSSFRETVGNQFIFVKVDFPEINQQPANILNQNQALREEFCVESFPTIIMLDPKAREMTRLSYVREEPEQFGHHLKRLLFDYQLLEKDCSSEDLRTASSKTIESLYARATKLQSPHYMEQLLEAGLLTDEGVALPLEKYSELVLNNQTHTPHAELLKNKILERDLDNQHGTRLRLALLEFQANKENPEKALKALHQYINDFGSNDKDNLWRLHLIISDYLSSRGKSREAQEHKEKSLSLRNSH